MMCPPGVLRERVAALTAAVGASAFLATLVGIDLASSERASSTLVSDMANGPYGTLFTAVTLTHVLANLGLAWVLARVLHPSPLTRIGALLVAIAALGTVTAAVFPTDPPGTDVTPAGSIHLAAASLSFTIEPIALLLLAQAATFAQRWGRVTTASALQAIGGLVALLWQQRMGLVPGGPERVVLLTLAAWEGGTAAWILRGRLTNVNRAHENEQRS